MKAVVLAAGEGARMGPFTASEPKVMIPVGNRPLLEYVVQAPVCENLVIAAGPPPPRGFSGAAAIELSTGRVAGLLSSYRHGQHDDYGPGTTDEARVVPLSLLPPSFR